MKRPYRLLAQLSLALMVSACVQPALAPTPGGASTQLPTLSATLAPTVTLPVQTQHPATSSIDSTLLPHNPPTTCPITSAPTLAFTPPAPYPATPPARYVGQFWYGTPELWTMLGAGGTWSGLPHSDAPYTQKVFWWRQGYNAVVEQKPHLTVTGRRLDAAAAPLVASSATNASADFGDAMLVGVDLPTLGCWEITGHYNGHELSFVVWVAP
jgi:hypothetical protein